MSEIDVELPLSDIHADIDLISDYTEDQNEMLPSQN